MRRAATCRCRDRSCADRRTSARTNRGMICRARAIDAIDLGLGDLRATPLRLRHANDPPLAGRVHEDAEHVRARAEDRGCAATDDHDVAARGVLAHRVLDRAQAALRRTVRRRRYARAPASRVRDRSSKRSPSVAPCPRSPRRPRAYAANASRPRPEAAGRRIRSRAPRPPASRSASAPAPYSFEIVTITGEGVRSGESTVILPIIETRDLRKVFRTPQAHAGRPRRAALAFLHEYEERVAVDDVTLSLEAGRAGRLHRPERRRQIDDDQDAHRHPGSDLGRGSRRGTRAVEAPARRTRATSASSSGSASQLYWDLPLVESFELLRAIYGVPARPVPAQPGRVRRDSRDGRIHAHAGSPAFARPAHARRLRGRDAARSADRLSRRTDDRARRRREGSDPRVHRAHQRRARHDHHLDDARSRRRRAALPADRAHRRGTLIYDGDIERIKSEYGRFRTLVVRFGEPVEQPASRGRGA